MGASTSITSRRPPKAPIGRPPPTTLPKVHQAGSPQGAHRRLRAAGYEPEQVAARDAARDRLGQQHLALGGRAERRALGGGPADGLDDLRMGVTENRRAVGLDVVDVACALNVP